MYYLLHIGWGYVNRILGFRAKWFIGFKAFKGHI